MDEISLQTLHEYFILIKMLCVFSVSLVCLVPSLSKGVELGEVGVDLLGLLGGREESDRAFGGFCECG
jgi:hypothetical protein